MQSPNDILEEANRRPYHLAIGIAVCTTIYTVVLMGVRIAMS